MNMLPYSLACIVAAFALFAFARSSIFKTAVAIAALNGIGSLFFLVGTALVTPWLWSVPDKFEDTGYLVGLAVFPAVTIAILASAGGVKNACTDLWTLSHTRTP